MSSTVIDGLTEECTSALARPIIACQPKRLRRPLAAGMASCAYYQAVRRLVHVWSVVAGS